MERRLRFRDLVELGIVTTRPTLQNWIKDRGFPRGQLTGPNSRTWGADEVEAWLKSRPTATKPTPKSPGRRSRRSDHAGIEA